MNRIYLYRLVTAVLYFTRALTIPTFVWHLDSDERGDPTADAPSHNDNLIRFIGQQLVDKRQSVLLPPVDERKEEKKHKQEPRQTKNENRSSNGVKPQRHLPPQPGHRNKLW